MNQSAMEYLMTYGWAILIIAVVLGALYSLGVFNMSAYMPKIGPGACHVFRPNGPGTSWNVALTGSCSGYLPQYVTQFNGQSSQVDVGNGATLNFQNSIAISLWIKTTFSARIALVSKDNGGCGGSYNFYSSTATATTFDICGMPSTTTSLNFRDGSWHFIVGTYNGTSKNLYIDGVLEASTPANGIIHKSIYDAIIGNDGGGSYTNGSIANVQIYNTSLTANQIQYLYNEGIGGAPIYLQYLVGWWPLNGDTIDYSGNNNNGVPTNVIYSGTWTSGYYR